MSLACLVAYGDSDAESESSEGDISDTAITRDSKDSNDAETPKSSEVEAPVQTPSRIQTANIGTVDDIEDDDIFPSNVPQSLPSLKLPPPKHTADNTPLIGHANSSNSNDVKSDERTADEGSVLDDSIDTNTSNPSLLGLPTPKDVSKRNTTINIEEDEIEEEIKEKTSKLAAKALLPEKPAKRQPVKIAIPELPQYDSDDEEDEPAKKKIKKGSKGSGLFALLPDPKNLTVKTTNRPLLPYTLTKKPTPGPSQPRPPPVPVVKKQATISKSLVTGVPDDDSDEEADDSTSTNFFSLGPKSQVPLNVAPVVEEPEDVVSEPALRGPWQGQVEDLSSGISQQPALPTQDTSALATGALAGPSLPDADADYNLVNSEQDEEQTELQQYLQDEEFLKLAGRRGRNREQIDFIDIQAEQQTSTEELTKNITEEVSGHSYSRKRKDLPSSQQRRKHQITYLAFQAKERELELKNQWAQSRVTKKQTQAKYGF